MLNNYTIEARLKGHYTIRDYHCPPGWRGSGVYDKEVPCTVDITADVTAKDEDRAENIVYEYGYDTDTSNPLCVCVEDVEVVSVTLRGEGEDEEAVEITYGDCKDTHPDMEPDPDDLYDRRRDDRGTGDI